ncbi:MAG: hypothetical protein A3I05_03070 [Deltaproteobacteria bacterium RIFCSPLOWO2_02_FULL_44_10]|nr:MAG: hypothetical protein A3C46_09050 [Deltaproteobacteria bacterium RIFCSPHIGHO2_02_FULL_44_16]OGQ46862.1 MAG: hypothetical protein A3I05_03070 [Deltaproteobacteria bacterium RIFCSPLOWO2_02_FULL_44_10]
MVLCISAACGSGLENSVTLEAEAVEKTAKTKHHTARFSSNGSYKASSAHYQMNGASFETFSYSAEALENLIVADSLNILNKEMHK